nr:Ig-like domain-containing protein [Vibrio fluvialis]
MAVHPSADLADGTYVLSVKVTDDAGNSATSETLAVTIDTVAAATITVDAIAGDDIVNAQEAQGTVTITGTVGGDANVDDTVTLTVNGKEYTGKVFADAEGKLVYSIDVQGSDLVADADSTIVASVSGTDEAGNAFTATTEASGDHKDGGYEVDTEISKPTIDLVASSDSGDSDTDNLTNDKTPTFALGNIDSDVAAEDIVVLKDGVALDGTLENVNGTWQFTPSADLADGTYVLSVKVTDDAGNSATSETLAVTIDTVAAATITVDAIAGDDIVNAQEAQGTVTITGTVGGDANVDDTVTLTVNGKEYTGKVFADAEGKLVYSIDVQGSDLVADADSTIVASVSGTDEAGNAFTATTEASGDHKDGGYEVDTEISKPTIDLVASSDSGDSDTDNLTNDKTPTFALGNIDSDVAAEDIVVLKDGVALDGTLENVNGTWQFTPSADLADGTYVLSVKVTDDAGNSATSETLAVTIDTVAAATITVDAIAGDDIVNAQEAQGTVTITGTVGGDANVDDTVTLTVNGKEYTGKVFADAEGKLVYSIDVQGSDLVADADSTIVASVSGTDEAGNAFTATTEASGDHKDGGYEVDTEISKPTIDLVASSDSGDSDTDNLTNDKTPTFALGNIDSDVAAEDIVVLKDGVALDGTLENVNGTWQFTPSADLADGTYVLSVKVTDDAGNSATSETLAVTIDTVAAATITVDAIAGDDIVNAQEAQGTVTITGTVGGDANVDDTVTLTVNGKEYTGKVFADAEGKLVYSIDVQGSDLVADADSTIVASVSGTDEAGNAFTATTEASGDHKDGGYEVDTEISKPTIDLVASSDSGDSDTDNLTNDKTPTFALGNIDSDVAAEDIVVLKDGVALDGTLENVNGTWQFTPSADLADGTYVLSVKVTDDAGNSATSETLAVTIDTVAAATITVDAIAGDDIVNAQEAQGTVTITGTVGGDANVDDTVTLTVNGKEYTGKVFADAEGKLVYSIDVQGSDLVADADSTIVASVSGTDEAGNAFTATTEASGDHKDGGYEVDTEISKPTIDLVASSDSGDSDTDNLTNDKTPTFALGNIDSDVAAEDIVVLKDGVALDGTLENVNGTWQFTPSADLADGTYVLSVKVTDDAGNSATSETLAVTIDTVAAATITVDAIAGDDIVNAQEAQGTVTITGTVGGDANVDDTVTLTVNGKEYTGKVFADAEGKLVYSIDVQGSDLVADADSTIVASVSGTDEAGNAFTATTEASGDHKDGGYEVDTEISKPTIDLVASSDSGDSDTDNLTNDKTPTFALGNIDSDVAAEDIVVLKDGVALDGTLENVNGTWQFTPSADLADGTYVLSVKVTDDAGNSATSETLAVTIDTVAAATITVDAIAGDDIVNAQEAQGTVTITGTVGGD